MCEWACVQLIDMPGVENAGGSASYVDMGEGQGFFLILDGFHMTPVYQQNDLFGVVVDYRHLRKEIQVIFFREGVSFRHG